MQKIFIIIFLICCSNYVNAESSSGFPILPNTGNNAHIILNKAGMLRTGNKENQIVKEHNGYKVIDSDGNIFYTDSIENPSVRFYLNYIEDNSGVGPKADYDINSYIEIDTLIFD